MIGSSQSLANDLFEEETTGGGSCTTSTDCGGFGNGNCIVANTTHGNGDSDHHKAGVGIVVSIATCCVVLATLIWWIVDW